MAAPADRCYQHFAYVFLHSWQLSTGNCCRHNFLLLSTESGCKGRENDLYFGQFDTRYSSDIPLQHGTFARSKDALTFIIRQIFGLHFYCLSKLGKVQMNGVDKLLGIVLLLFEKMFACCIWARGGISVLFTFCCNDFVMRKVFGVAKMLLTAWLIFELFKFKFRHLNRFWHLIQVFG